MDFGILDGVTVSIFSILIVILILVVLALIVSLLRYLPSKEEKNVQKQKPVMIAQKQAAVSDEEERMVAMLVASCIAKEKIKQDVRIVSIERIK